MSRSSASENSGPTAVHDVVFLNPQTCGIYKNGGTRFKTDLNTGIRTDKVDNELLEVVEAYVAGERTPGEARIALGEVMRRGVLVPTYYDRRHVEPVGDLLRKLGVKGMTLGQLLDKGELTVRSGHGSPSNDQRSGSIPYIKVSDIRGLRVNVNPTNLVTESVARRFWRGAGSGLQAWDLISPNRASSNIGEFAVLLPGEEQVVLTKEVFVVRIEDCTLYNHFYLLWALTIRAVREQWRRVTLMQTNREDCGERYREVILPRPPSREWADEHSKAFREYFEAIAVAKGAFYQSLASEGLEHIASACPSSGAFASPTE